MEKAHTCGQGLALHASLPATCARLMAAVADNLEWHLRGIGQDAPGELERAAYVSLAARHRFVAGSLDALATEMAGYRDLPMGAHDLELLSAPEAVRAFEGYVQAKERLLALLQQSLADDRALMAMMKGE
jgi:hypothetical protein